MIPIPWSLPAIGGPDTATRIRWPGATSDTAGETTNSPSITPPPPIPEPPRVGRPHRGDRSKVKAARRSRLQHRR